MEEIRELREGIEGVVKTLRGFYGIKGIIEDIEGVVEKIGGKVEYSDALVVVNEGEVEKRGEGFIVRVSKYTSEQRKQVSIARCIGYVFMEMGYKFRGEVWDEKEEGEYNIGEDRIVGVMATEFAYALLMPEELYKGVIGNEYIVDLEEAAKKFRVSVSDVEYRGKVLGLFKW